MFTLKAQLGLGALLVGLAASSQAAVSWNFTSSGNGDRLVSTTTGGTYEMLGSDTTSKVKLSAWSANSSGSIQNSNSLLAQNGYGLVIDQDGYTCDANGLCNYGNSGGDSHQIDNGGFKEFVMFDFGNQEFSLSNFNIGYTNSDSDVTVMAYQGSTAPANLSTLNLSTLSANGWSVISHHSNASTGNEAVNSNLNNVYSSYWIIGAYMSGVGSGGDTISDSTWDDLKLAGIAGGVKPKTPPPTGEVPLPGTLALVAAGLLLVARRRR